MQHPALVLSLLLAALAGVAGRDDGLARTPPMGWSTWYAFGANLNETRVVQMADAIVRTGLRDAGYKLVNLDDAWLSPSRDRLGNIQGDPTRFPSGIKWLADEMHSRGLLLGLYGCPGVRTCEG
jgi:alpha-galactosidase